MARIPEGLLLGLGEAGPQGLLCKIFTEIGTARSQQGRATFRKHEAINARTAGGDVLAIATIEQRTIAAAHLQVVVADAAPKHVV